MEYLTDDRQIQDDTTYRGISTSVSELIQSNDELKERLLELILDLVGAYDSFDLCMIFMSTPNNLKEAYV